jgi:hypothetical protein
MVSETSRTNNSCIFQNSINTNTANYSCTVNMLYYDKAGYWNVVIGATDSKGATVNNNSRTFMYNSLNAINITSSLISWSSINPGAINQTPIQFTIINNTGNYNGPVYIVARNLTGQSVPSESISADLFRAGISTGGFPPVECGATQLQDGNGILITGSNLPRGAIATEQIYYCLTQVPYVSSQSYSATGANSWTLQI